MNRVYSVRIANIFASVVMVLPAPLRQDSVSAPKAGRDSLVIGHAAATNMASIVSRIARVEMAAHVTRKMVAPSVALSSRQFCINLRLFFFYVFGYIALPCMLTSNLLRFTTIGTCTCGPGYFGEHCEMRCERGYFGPDCKQKCQCVEGHSQGCDPVTGKCICLTEWKGNIRSCTRFCIKILVVVHF